MRKGDGLDISDKSPHGCKRVQVPTEEEVAALNAMRDIKKEARSLKERMQSLQVDSRERLELQERIDRLKTEWSGWEEKRKAEAKRRMILLGHEKP
jgi:hypothetical protein